MKKIIEHNGKKYKMIKEDYFGMAQPCCFSEMKKDPVTHKYFITCNVPDKKKFTGCKHGTCYWIEI